MTIEVTDAILAINPNASVRVLGNDLDRIDWYNETPVISKSDLQAKMTELQADYDAKEYQRLRKPEYPSIESLVVALYDSDDKAAIDEKRAEIKLKYPKPVA
tara:strand:+ start:160 stop:465 length:306 start_codon:yes stop_codon:yes gene_type:complete